VVYTDGKMLPPARKRDRARLCHSASVSAIWEVALSRFVYTFQVLETLRAELKAIQNWPCGEMVTETEKDAVAFRAFRTIELEKQIAELVSRN